MNTGPFVVEASAGRRPGGSHPAGVRPQMVLVAAMTDAGLTVDGYTIKPLGPDTWEAFAQLAGAHAPRRTVPIHPAPARRQQ
jgi:hypothetical protein